MKKTTLFFIMVLVTISIQAQDFSSLYKKMVPSVVTIMVKEVNLETDKATMQKHMITSEGLGSGVLISEKGEVWTAAHVVQTAEEVMVKFKSGEVVPAKVITVNKAADVAMIRLLYLPKDYSVATIANSDDVNIGDQIFIIGAPYGIEHSLSVGYISGRLADKEGSTTFTKSEYFQTDAAINHGNSGGPMFNTKGEVIGLVSSILSQSGGFDGIGFVVTSEVAKLHLTGDQPFWYGADFKIITGSLRSVFNLSQSMGLLVQKVAAGSPSAMSGLRPGIFSTNIEGMEIMTGGDIIIKIGDNKVALDMDLDLISDYLSGLKPNQTFKVTILREGKVIELIGVVPSK